MTHLLKTGFSRWKQATTFLDDHKAVAVCEMSFSPETRECKGNIKHEGTYTSTQKAVMQKL